MSNKNFKLIAAVSIVISSVAVSFWAISPTTKPDTAAEPIAAEASLITKPTDTAAEELKTVVYTDGASLISDDPAVQGVGADENGNLVIRKLQGEELSAATQAYIANSPRPIQVVDQVGRVTTLISESDDSIVAPTAVDTTRSLIGGAPWGAGSTESGPPSGICSMGFPGYDSTGARVVITAGHCTGGNGSSSYMHGLTPASQPAVHGGGSASATLNTANIATLDSWAFGQYGQVSDGQGAVDNICRSSSGFNPACYSDIAVYKTGANASAWTDYARVTKWNAYDKTQNNLINDSVVVSNVAYTVSGSISRSGRTTGFASGVVTDTLTLQLVCENQSESSCRVVPGLGACIDTMAGDSGGSFIQSNTDGTFSAVGVLSGGGDVTSCTQPPYSQPYANWAIATSLVDALDFLRATNRANKTYRVKVQDPVVTAASADSPITGKAGKDVGLEIAPVTAGDFNSFSAFSDGSGNWSFDYSKVNTAAKFKVRVFDTYEQSEWVEQDITITAGSGCLGNTLSKGDVLNTGECLRSANKTYKLVLQNDGNLVLYHGNTALWHTSTGGRGNGARLVSQEDGNIVLYAANNSVLWHSHTGGRGGGDLTLQDDGNLVLYATALTALWNSSTGGHGASRLAMQGDGNLVAYRNHDNAATWHTSTGGRGSSYLTMQNDGNLVVYRNSGGATWNTGTGASRQSSFAFSCTRTGTLDANNTLDNGETLCSPNNAYQLAMQGDGNLVIYTHDTSATWCRYW